MLATLLSLFADIDPLNALAGEQALSLISVEQHENCCKLKGQICKTLIPSHSKHKTTKDGEYR